MYDDVKLTHSHNTNREKEKKGKTNTITLSGRTFILFRSGAHIEKSNTMYLQKANETEYSTATKCNVPQDHSVVICFSKISLIESESLIGLKFKIGLSWQVSSRDERSFYPPPGALSI